MPHKEGGYPDDLLHQLARVSASEPGAGKERRLGSDQEVVGQEDEAEEGGDRWEAAAAQVGHPEDVLAGLEERLDRLPLVVEVEESPGSSIEVGEQQGQLALDLA